VAPQITLRRALIGIEMRREKRIPRDSRRRGSRRPGRHVLDFVALVQLDSQLTLIDELNTAMYSRELWKIPTIHNDYVSVETSIFDVWNVAQGAVAGVGWVRSCCQSRAGLDEQMKTEKRVT